MDYKFSLKKTLAGIMALAIVAGMQPGYFGGNFDNFSIVANADAVEKAVVTVTQENAEETLTNMQADTIYEVSESLSVSRINVVGAGAELRYTGSEAGTITTTDSEKRGIYVDPNTSLVISRSSKAFTIDMSGSKESQATIDDYSTFTLNTGVTIIGTVAYFRDSIVNINGGNVKTSDRGGYALSGNSDYPAKEVNITGGNITSSDSIAIFQPQTGKLNISGGTIKGKTAVYARSGEINITGGTFEATGDYSTPNTIANGADPTGDCIAMQAYSTYYGPAPVLTISKGTFKTANGEAVASYKVDENEEPATISITGGTFKKGSEAADVSQFYADNGIDYVQDGAGGIFNAADVVMEFTNVNGVTSYKTSVTPSSFSSSGTYRLLADATLTARLAPGILASNVTIDLNGFNLTSTATDYAVLLNRAGSESSHKSFVITNSSDTPSVFDTNASQSIQIQGKYNDFVLDENIKLNGDICVVGDSQTVDVYGDVVKNGDTAIATNGSSTKNAFITIHDGASVTSDTIAVYQPSSTSILNIEGGTITGSTAVYAKAGQVVVNGGTLHATGEKKDYEYYGNGCNSTGDALVLESSSSGYGGAPRADIAGGTLISDNAEAIGIYSYEDTPFDPPVAEVSGGLFSDDVSENVPEGYRATMDEETGLFSVVQDMNEYSLTFDPNGGEGEIDPITGPYNRTVFLPDCTFEPPFEKKFVKWVINEEDFEPGDEVALTDNFTATAVWEDAKVRQDLSFDDDNITKTFGDDSFQIIPNGAITPVEYRSTNEDVLIVSDDGTVTIVGAGEAEITATAVEDDYYFSGTASYTVTVEKQDFELECWIADWKYGETPNDVDIRGNYTGETPIIEYKPEDADDSYYSGDIPTEAGSYTVRVTVPESANYNSSQAQITFSINPADNEWIDEPSGYVGLQYDGTELDLVSVGEAEGGRVLYKLGEDGTYSESVPTAMFAGTYTVYYLVEGENNYTDIQEQSVTVEIAPRECSFEWGDTELIFTGAPQTPEVILHDILEVDEGDCRAEISGAQSDPGTYIAKVTGLTNPNYVLTGDPMTAFSIVKREYAVIIDANGGSGSRVKEVVGEAEEYELMDYEDYGFIPPENKKFVGWDVDGVMCEAGDTITIDDVTLIKAIWDDAKIYQEDFAFDDNKIEKTFGDDPFVNEIFGAETPVTYESSDETIAVVDEDGIVNIVGAGTVIITAHAEEDDDFFGADASYRLVVAKAPIWLNVFLDGWKAGETPNIPEVSGNDGDADVAFEYKAVDAEEFTSEVPTEPGTYTVRAVVDESENYLGGSAETDFIIEEGEPQINAELITGNTVGFKENIVLNFYADIDAEYAEGSFVIFTYDHYGETKTVRADFNSKNTYKAGQKTYYAFGCPLSVSEMTMDVTAELYLADSEEPVSVQYGSIASYCDRMLTADSINEKTRDALKALLNFGGYTQLALELNTDSLANAGYEEDMSSVTVVPSGEFVKPEEKVGGVQYLGAQLAMRDSVNCRYVFAVDSLDGVTFTINGKEVTPVKMGKSGKNYYIDAEAVKAVNLANVNEINVSTASGDIFFKHSIMDYAYGKADGDDENLSNAMKAMYDYYLKVTAYVNQ